MSIKAPEKVGCSVFSVNFNSQPEAHDAVQKLAAGFWNSVQLAGFNHSEVHGNITMTYTVSNQNKAESTSQNKIEIASESIRPIPSEKTQDEIPPSAASRKTLHSEPAAKKAIEFSVQGFGEDKDKKVTAQIRHELEAFKKVAITPEGEIRPHNRARLEDMEIYYFEIKGRKSFTIHLPADSCLTSPTPVRKIWASHYGKQQQQLRPGNNEVSLQDQNKKFIFTVPL